MKKFMSNKSTETTKNSINPNTPAKEAEFPIKLTSSFSGKASYAESEVVEQHADQVKRSTKKSKTETNLNFSLPREPSQKDDMMSSLVAISSQGQIVYNERRMNASEDADVPKTVSNHYFHYLCTLSFDDTVSLEEMFR